MSYRPQELGFFAPTGGSFPAALPVNQPYSPSSLASSPNEYFVVVPARQQYSHSVSVGNRINSSPLISFCSRNSAVALWQNACASSYVNISTEFRFPFHLLGLLPITASHRFCG